MESIMTNGKVIQAAGSLLRFHAFHPNIRIFRQPIPSGRYLEGFTSGEAAAYFMIAALIDVVACLSTHPSMLQGYLSDPDTMMRLVRLHDILTQHVPLHIVARDGSGDGTILHWSHLLDSFLLLLGLPLRLWISWDRALHAAAMALGPISVGLLGVAAAWATAPLAERCWRWSAPVLAALSPVILDYGAPGVADHHVLLAVGAVMMAGAAGRVALGDIRAGFTLGVWCAASLWLLPESGPFIVMAFGGVGIAWMVRPAAPNISTGISLAGTVLFFLVSAELMVDPPVGGYWSATLDALSITYQLLAAGLCGIAWCLFMIDRQQLLPNRRSMLGGGIAVAGLLLWLVLFPALLRGTEVLSNTPEAQTMFSSINEFMPARSPIMVLTFLLTGACAAALLVWLAVRDRSTTWKSVLWSYAALCVFVCLALGQSHVRFTTYAGAAAATMLPVALTELTRMLAGRPESLQATARLGLLAAVLAPLFVDTVASVCGFNEPELQVSYAPCDLGTVGSALEPLAGEVVLAGVNDSAGLLYRTPVRTVGSLYHASIAGYSRLRAAWRSGPSDAEPDEVRATRAAFVLYCPQAGRSALVADLPEQTLWDQLARGDVPAWLRPVLRDAHSKVVLYRVIGSSLL